MSLATARYSALSHSRHFYLRRMVQDNVPGICRRCFCTERRACNPPCHWVTLARNLCSACAPAHMPREYWTAEEVTAIAREERIPLTGSLSSVQCYPGCTRASIVERLRMVAAIPDDPGPSNT